MKKILTLLLIMALAVSVLASCDKIPDKLKFWEKNTDETPNETPDDKPAQPAVDADLKAAYDFVHNTVKEIAEKTNANYTLPGVAPVKDTPFTVTWTVSDDRIKLEASEDGKTVTVVVPEPGDADIAYTLTFVVTNAKGETLTRSYNHIVPKFQVNTYAEYRAAADGDSVVVEGVVYGIMSKAAGDSENSVYVQDLNCGGGYYVYQLSDDEIAKAVIGQTVKVKGNKTLYYDLPEIKDATLEVINSEITTLTPTDITNVFKSVDNATDKDSPLLDYVGGYVTIKGVTLLEPGDNGYYYFELDGVKTYFRISSSSNCTTADEEKAIKNNFAKYFYYTADLTGIATLYKKGDDYWFNVLPLTGDTLSNFSEEMQPMPDDVKANFIADKLTTPSEMVSTNSVNLPLVGTDVVDMSVFENVNIAWTLAETANATLVDGVLTAVLPESGSVNVTLTAKVIVNKTEVVKTFTIAVKKLVPLTITDANAKAEAAGTSYTTEKFIVEGIIDEVKSDKYGNVYIKDADGNRLYVYGIYSAYGELRYDAMAKNGAVPKLGDKVVLYGVLGTYNSDKQMKNAWLLSWEHIHNFVAGETVEPSCVQGYTVYTCAGCGASENRDFTNAVAEHNYEQVVGWHPEMVAADCVTVGVDVYMCYGCNDYYTQQTAIDPDGHAFWGDSVVLTEPNCVNKTNGTERVSCANGCGATEDQEVDYYWAHDWDVQVDTYPTCTEDGAYYAECTLCEEFESEERPAEGHWSWTATCGESTTCEACGVEYTVEHNTAFTPATCTEAAYCMRCWSYVGEPNGHKWGDDGKCTVCELPNHTCDFSVKGETVDPTCTEGGYTVYGCSFEGCTATENKDETNPTNHVGTTENKDAVAPTCSAVGYTAGVYCTACQTWLEGHEEQATVADAHTDVNGDFECDGETCEAIVLPAAGSTLTLAQAQKLGELYINETGGSYTPNYYYVTGTIVEFTGSNWAKYGGCVITDGTTNFAIYGLRDSTGEKLYEALDVKPVVGDTIKVYGQIGAYKSSVQIEKGWIKEHTAHEHDYSEGACLATQVCSICKGVKGDHSYDDGVVTTAATCTATGVKTYTCVCTATKTETLSNLGGHNFVDGACDREGCEATAGTYVPAYNKVTSADKFTTGTYVLVVSTANVTFSEVHSTNTWVVGETLNVSGDSITQATGDQYAITLTVTDAGVTIKIGDKYIAPKGGNTNGLTIGTTAYNWAYSFDNDGNITFKGTGSDTVTLAYNSTNSSTQSIGPAFRGYKNTTVTSSTYYTTFAVYKLG